MWQAKETFKYLLLGYIHIMLKQQNKNKNLIDIKTLYVLILHRRERGLECWMKIHVLSLCCNIY